MRDTQFVANDIERASRVLSAINLLSIDAKLTLLKSRNPIGANDLAAARQTLLEFAGELSDLIRKAEMREGHTVLGTDLRTAQLASHLRHAMMQDSPPHELAEMRLDSLPRLLDARDECALSTLVRYLDQLRSLIERHSYAEATGISGESGT
jgi:hypothetical protein